MDQIWTSLGLKILKFIYSEKATKFCEISTLLLSVCTVDNSKVEISQNFVAFSEYTNFSWRSGMRKVLLEYYKNMSEILKHEVQVNIIWDRRKKNLYSSHKLTHYCSVIVRQFILIYPSFSIYKLTEKYRYSCEKRWTIKQTVVKLWLNWWNNALISILE